MEQITLSREALYELVWSSSLLSLSKQYDLSNNGFRKLCIRMEIPLPKNGHWQQVKYGKADEQPPLHYPYTGEIEATLRLREERTAENRISKTVSKAPSPVSKQLAHPHPLVIRSKAALERTEPDRSRFLNMLSCGDSGLDIKVTKINIGRALRIMDSLIKALEAAGHSIALQNGRTYVTLGTDTFRMQLREQTTKAHASSERVGFTQYQSTGKLAFSVGIGHMREFRDGMKTLEEQLPVILEHFEAVNQEWLQLRLSQRIRKDAEEEQERILQEVDNRRNKEVADFKTLLEKAERWYKAGNLRRYINEVERRGNSSDSEDLRNWLEWAREKADWYDPFVERTDVLMGQAKDH